MVVPKRCLLLALLLPSMAVSVTAEVPIVVTDKGSVRGFTEYVASHKKVHTFLGIPYATPPLGDLRFKPPIQLDPWKGYINATQHPNSCIQSMDMVFPNFTGSSMWNANTPMSEDCLYLSVWAPRTNPPYHKKHVLVWIYGGGFYSGSTTLDIYDAKYLAAENDVVVVSMQYRVGALGFLSLNSVEAPGNAGLWDQRMALEWVNRNIHLFGGDPQSVTLMGESAGAVSVGLFLICDLCRGYFHKAILQSGAPGANWGALPKSQMWERSIKFSGYFGCEQEGDADQIVQCLRKKNATTFPDNESRISSGSIQFPFVPVIDGIFIRKDPSEMLRKGEFKKIPLLLGSNQNEASFFIVYYFEQWKNYIDKEPGINPSSYSHMMDYIIPYFPHFNTPLSMFGKHALTFQYRNWLNPEDHVEVRKSIEWAVSDAHFICPVNELATAYARQDLPVYYYWFSQRWSANPWPPWMGVLHADEIWFTFGHPTSGRYSFTKEETELSRKMMNYWVNFAKTGNPNHAPGEPKKNEWPLFRHNEQKYINLSVDSMKNGWLIGQGPRTQQCAFWDIYLPKLVRDTSNMSELELEWKEQFYEWKTHYIEDWKLQFDAFRNNFQRRMGSCSGGHP